MGKSEGTGSYPSGAGEFSEDRVASGARMAVKDGEYPIRKDAAYEAFVACFARAEPGLRSFVRPLVPTWEDVQEVIQQTSLVLWRKFDQFRPDTSFLAWACAIARLEALKYRRTRARDRHVFSEELITLLADEGAGESERRERERRALDGCMRRLAPSQRELVEKCYSGGSNIRAAAESLGRSATSLYKALNRIRRALLECIERSLAQEVAP